MTDRFAGRAVEVNPLRAQLRAKREVQSMGRWLKRYAICLVRMQKADLEIGAPVMPAVADIYAAT
jgi:hypothetical protein